MGVPVWMEDEEEEDWADAERGVDADGNCGWVTCENLSKLTLSTRLLYSYL